MTDEELETEHNKRIVETAEHVAAAVTALGGAVLNRRFALFNSDVSAERLIKTLAQLVRLRSDLDREAARFIPDDLDN